jgi:hypothetical protein
LTDGAAHRAGQHGQHRVVQYGDLFAGQFPGRRERRDLGDVQDLVAVGVADAGDDLLVGEDGLDPPAVSGE